MRLMSDAERSRARLADFQRAVGVSQAGPFHRWDDCYRMLEAITIEAIERLEAMTTLASERRAELDAVETIQQYLDATQTALCTGSAAGEWKVLDQADAVLYRGSPRAIAHDIRAAERATERGGFRDYMARQ